MNLAYALASNRMSIERGSMMEPEQRATSHFEETCAPTGVRRPYRAPAIRALGSVRELTLTGGTFPIVDSGTTHKVNP
jgi:hypothetical protein